MGIYVAEPENVQTMRLWDVNRLVGRSSADGRYHLDVDGGGLVGVAPEARVGQSTPARTLEQRV
ncbi:hypothetical protein HYY71_03805 [Candidatus Woesearchaeota archaeon]|nr:hypothetical protein [Candidatus Woesearchaeota archaeon]